MCEPGTTSNHDFLDESQSTQSLYLRVINTRVKEDVALLIYLPHPCGKRLGDGALWAFYVSFKNRPILGQFKDKRDVQHVKFSYIYMSLPTAFATSFNSSISFANSSGLSDCSPSTRASDGFGCTSISKPSAPAAIAAFASAGTRSR
jgi:hypothetical protein